MTNQAPTLLHINFDIKLEPINVNWWGWPILSLAFNMLPLVTKFSFVRPTLHSPRKPQWLRRSNLFRWIFRASWGVLRETHLAERNNQLLRSRKFCKVLLSCWAMSFMLRYITIWVKSCDVFFPNKDGTHYLTKSSLWLECAHKTQTSTLLTTVSENVQRTLAISSFRLPTIFPNVFRSFIVHVSHLNPVFAVQRYNSKEDWVSKSW